MPAFATEDQVSGHISAAVPKKDSASSSATLSLPAVEPRYIPRQSVVRPPLPRSVHDAAEKAAKDDRPRREAAFKEAEAAKRKETKAAQAFAQAAPASAVAARDHRVLAQHNAAPSLPNFTKPVAPTAPASVVAPASNKSRRVVVAKPKEAAAAAVNAPSAAAARPISAGTASTVYDMATSMLPLKVHEAKLKATPKIVTGMTPEKREMTMELAKAGRGFVDQVRGERPSYDEAIRDSHGFEVASSALGLTGSALSLSGVGAPVGHAFATAAAVAKLAAASEENEAATALSARPKSPTGRGWALVRGHRLNSKRQAWQAGAGFTPIPLGGFLTGKAHDRINKEEKDDINSRFVNGVLQNMPPGALPSLRREPIPGKAAK